MDTIISQEDLTKYQQFRRLCLVNSEDAISTAEKIKENSVNHIAFQLLVFGLEEIGKIFVGWYQINAKETWGKEHYNIPLDDHVKKLFWAIWGPSFMKQMITKTQMDEIRNLATFLHNRRLDVMYTELSDTIPSSQKISYQELEYYLTIARARLELAKLEGNFGIEDVKEKEEDVIWFMETCNHVEKRKYVFGNLSQEKLIELGDVRSWILWLKEHFQYEEAELKEILQKELQRSSVNRKVSNKPKWKIRIKVSSQSHSIRANILDKFNLINQYIKFSKGSDSHTLLIDLILDESILVNKLWNYGWTTSNLLVASLNVGTNGLFYWNLPKDIDKYYDQIWDLEINRPLETKLLTSLELDWSTKHMYLQEEELIMTLLIYRYFTSTLGSRAYEAIYHYTLALGMLAKNDMHLRLEPQCFLNFYLAYKKARIINEKPEKPCNIKEEGYKRISKILKERSEYDKIIELGAELEETNGQIKTGITLTEIIGMKQYAGLYFIHLAVKKFYGEDAVIISKERYVKNKGSS